MSNRINQTSLYTFSDNPSSNYRYGPELEPAFDITYVANHIEVNGPDGSRGLTGSGIAVDAGVGSSTEDYGIVVKSVDSQLTDGGSRQALAEYLLFRYKQPQERLPELHLNGESNPSVMWPVILGLEISDPITVERFAGLTSPMSLPLSVEGIRFTGSGTTGIQAYVRTSPRDTTSYWTIEHATRGFIDSTNYIAP